MTDRSDTATVVNSDRIGEQAARLEQLFVRQAERTPKATALLHRGKAVSYEDLDERSNRIAQYLRTLGVGPGVLVAVCLERTPDLVASLLGVLKAGGAYVPLDPSYPADRLSFILQDSLASVLLTHSGLMSGIPHLARRCDLDHCEALLAIQPTDVPETGATPKDPAYVIYTSGSTGQPKGVVLSHTATGLIRWATQSFPSGEASRMAAATSVCFDPSILEIFVPLCTGGLAILKQDALEPYTPDEQPTMLNGPPSVLGELARARAIPESVRVINIGGEVLAIGLVHEIYRACKVERIFNHYGPTETTTCATVAYVDREATHDPSIGQPICDARIYILDEQLQPVAEGERGEIFIAGPTVADSYLNDPVRTAARFLTDPFHTGDRMYRTGDLGRFSPEKDLEFLGRIDDQVKLRGFRIELGEVETALLRLPDIRQAAALVKRDRAGRDKLVAYVASSRKLTIANIRRELAPFLPTHMLPAALVLLEELPLGPTMKIDRSALPDLSNAPVQQGGGWLPPRQAVIANVFRQSLGAATVGADDDFFELGGDSLSALEACLEIEALLGQPVAPAMLAHHPTPRLLEAALESHPVDWTSHVATLQPKGARRALFCVPDIYGRPLSYGSLARSLSPDQPIYGLSPGPLAGVIAETPSMSRLTQAYVTAVRELQPTGPYLISGYSFGAAFAQDLAAALEEIGEEAVLILVDGPVFKALPSMGYIVRWAIHEGRRLLAELGPVNTLRAMYRSRSVWRRWFRPRSKVRLADVPPFVPRSDKRLARALIQASVDHKPRVFAGRTLFVPANPPEPTMSFLNADGLYGWRNFLVGEISVHPIAASHYAMMQEPNVGEIASLIREVEAQIAA